MIDNAVAWALQHAGLSENAENPSTHAIEEGDVRMDRDTSPQMGTSGLQRESQSPRREEPGRKRKCQCRSESTDLDITLRIGRDRQCRDFDEVSVDSLSEILSDNGSEVSNGDGVDLTVINANRQMVDGDVDEFISQQYSEEPLHSFLPPVSQKLAETITRWCCNVPEREKIKTMFETTLVPENVTGLNPVRINEVLYERLSFRVKLSDQRMRGISSFITRGLGSLISILDSVLKFEKKLLDKVTVKSGRW